MQTLRPRTPSVSLLLAAATAATAATTATAQQAAPPASDIPATPPWASPAAEGLPPPPPRPNAKLVGRHFEDWRGVSENTAPLDQLRNIEVFGGDSLTFGGTVRLRYENFQNFFARPNEDDGYLLSHFRLHANWWLTEGFRVFAEGKSVFVTDRALPGGTRVIDQDTLDLHQLFAELTVPLGEEASVVLRGGRQELSFGRNRLVSPLPWANALRSWDGGRADFRLGGWTVSPFYTLFAPTQINEFNNPSTDIQFWGAYSTGPLAEGLRADLYFLGLDRDAAVTFNGTTGDEDRRTVGARLFRPKGKGLDFDIEGAWQFGEVGAGDVSAWFIDTEFGYTLGDAPFSPRFFAGGGAASGDNAPGGDVETFNQLFPLGHAFLGFADQIGRQNIIEVRGGLTLKLTKKLSLYAAGHYFWRQSEDDAVYNAGGGITRADLGSDERDVGAEFDLVLTYAVGGGLTLEAGYSRFFAGDFFEETGTSDNVDFFYLQAILLF